MVSSLDQSVPITGTSSSSSSICQGEPCPSAKAHLKLPFPFQEGGLPRWFSGKKKKNPPANAVDVRDAGSSLGWEDPWRRKWQPTPVFLSGKFHGQRSLVGQSPYGCKESGTTQRLNNQNKQLSRRLTDVLAELFIFSSFHSRDCFCTLNQILFSVFGSLVHF